MTSQITPQPANRGDVNTRTELIAGQPAEALAGLLDIDAPPLGDGDPLPPLWHWIYLLERRRQSELGHDGHPTRGIPAPPGPGQLRMFAGGRTTTFAPLRFGREATRTTRVTHTLEKEGRSGALTFVTTRSTYTQDEKVAFVDEQDIVYRRAGSRTLTQTLEAADPQQLQPEGQGLLELAVDPTVLFRFSALTYNAHRIHYDLAYASQEGYPGLVVHGPLQALLMGECFRRAGASLLEKQFAYRLVAPTYGEQQLIVTSTPDGDGLAARVQDGRGVITATASLRPLTKICPTPN